MFLSKDKLRQIGFKNLGDNILISDKCSIYSPQNIEIGNNVRIDDFVILSPSTSLKLGNYVHIACYSSIIGNGEIILEDFVGISGRVSIYSSSDDYTGMGMTNGPVHIKKHSIIGAGSIILPNVTIGTGCSVYAQTLIKTNCEDFSVYSGNPSKLVGKRLKKFLDYEKKFIGTN